MKDKRDQAQFNRQQAELYQLKEQHDMDAIDLYYCDESHFGLMTPDCKLLSWMVEGSINSDSAIAMLDEFADGLTRKTVVVMDNAPIHRSRKFMRKINYWARRKLLIYFLPPYSPELNLIEILWKHIKYRWLPFDAFLNFQNLKEQISQTLNLIGSKWIINY